MILKVRATLAMAGLLLAACVATDLTAPTNHPSHPDARPGELPELTALRSDFSPSSEPAAPEPATHDHGAQPTFTCPMHPDVVRPEPGSCPKCGMKLVPKEETP